MPKNGKVKAIYTDTKNISASSEKTSSVDSNYELFIEPTNTKLSSKRRNCLIRPGMEGIVDIVSKEETVLQFLLRKTKLTVDF